ncbi:hypothetical protein [Metabacillus arenae]|uniref:Uncharacterized protein n=1 Tax=Metabacillus arenae TaxID=2771434 RepID=A0A926NN91_9BACI|nr:hypothetical protein [Metabacillus arenae]MBD1380931.1 hypothetical protein [Metabacillus arenae]
MKRFFSLSNPLGIVITAATLILTVSPEARRGTKKLLVKGVGSALALGDQIKHLTTGARLQLSSLMEEAKHEKETMELPNMKDAMMEMTERGMEKSKETIHQAKATFGSMFSEPNDSHSMDSSPINVMNDHSLKQKMSEIENQLH